MSIFGVLIAAAIVGGTGIIIGLFLGVAGEKFKVEVDEKELAVRDCLPGNNCGGCGYAGCDALAKAIANGEANVDGCPVGGEAVAANIGKIMGQSGVKTNKLVAFVKCSGNCEKAGKAYDYTGPQDCVIAANTPGGGPKSCNYGCTGFGSCVKACEFGAIEVIDGVAHVNKDKCKSCGKCVAQCPKHLIELIPYDTPYMVACSSKDKGKDVKSVCSTGCIGCGICQKNCPGDYITVENNIARIDENKCAGCGICAEKCPSKVIKEI